MGKFVVSGKLDIYQFAYIYFEKLDPSAQKKYKKRLKVIENTDPSDSDFCVNIGDFPTA